MCARTDLPRYGSAYQCRILLVYVKLSGFKSEFERRLPELRRFVATLSKPRFDAVLLVDGNHHLGTAAAKL